MKHFEVRYADLFRCIHAETADAAHDIAVTMDALVYHLSGCPVVEVAEIVNEEDSSFYKLFQD